MISKEELLSMADENYIYEAKFGKIFFKKSVVQKRLDYENTNLLHH